VAIIDVENQNAFSRTAWLRPVRRAQIKVSLQFGMPGKGGEKAGQQEEKNSAHKKSFSPKIWCRQCRMHSLLEATL
jgi:hypothetical protein